MKPSWGQNFNLKEYWRRTFHHLQLLSDVKKEAVLSRLKYVMKFWNLFHAGCGNLPHETWDIGQCWTNSCVFDREAEKKNVFLSSPNIQYVILFFFGFLFCMFNTFFVLTLLVWVIRGDGTYTKRQIS